MGEHKRKQNQSDMKRDLHGQTGPSSGNMPKQQVAGSTSQQSRKQRQNESGTSGQQGGSDRRLGGRGDDEASYEHRSGQQGEERK